MSQLNLRCAPGIRPEGLAVRAGLPRLPLLAGWEYILCDVAETRVICYLFRSSLQSALAFKAAHSNQALQRSRIVCIVSEPSLELQITANNAGVELWFDGGNGSSLIRQLEFASTAAPQRVKPDESANFDLDMYRMLTQVSPSSDVKQLLKAAQTLQGVSNLGQARTAELAGKDEIYNFFHQVL